MFKNFYTLSNIPFSRDIPTSDLYEFESYLEALGRMEYAVSQNLFTVVTGECGTGKTTIARKLRDSLDSEKHLVMYLAECKLTPRYFYRNLIQQLGGNFQSYRGEAKHFLHRELEIMYGINGIQAVVIIDEAHLLEKEMLEELRFFLNYDMDAKSPLTLILLGQNELWNKLKLQACLLYTSSWYHINSTNLKALKRCYLPMKAKQLMYQLMIQQYGVGAVSYTHLDVYKRQMPCRGNVK